MLKTAVVASTNGTDMVPIQEAIQKGELDCEISLVVSNKPDAGALEKAKKWDLKYEVIDSKNMDKPEYEKKLLDTLKENEIELVLLIGYSRIVGDEICEEFRNRLINVHPSLLPAFAGAFNVDVHEAVLEKGCKVSGCTFHFVTPDIDEGPIVWQECVRIDEDETADSLKDKVQKAEGKGFIKVLDWFSRGKISVEGKRVRIG